MKKTKSKKVPHIDFNFARGHAWNWFSVKRRLENLLPGTQAVQCISCQKPLHWTKAQGGHFIPRKESSSAFVADWNIWPQCVPCNYGKEGNRIEYRKKLVVIYGENKLAELELLAKISVKRSAMDFVLLAREFRKVSEDIALSNGIDLGKTVEWLYKETKRMENKMEEIYGIKRFVE